MIYSRMKLLKRVLVEDIILFPRLVLRGKKSSDILSSQDLWASDRGSMDGSIDADDLKKLYDSLEESILIGFDYQIPSPRG